MKLLPSKWWSDSPFPLRLRSGQAVMQTLPNWLIGKTQKGTASGYTVHWCVVTTRMRPGVKHYPKVTTNGHSERSNPSKALSSGEQATRPNASVGRMAQEANAFGKASDVFYRRYADVGRVYGKPPAMEG